nr:CapA family protein [Niallia circulans]
MEIYKNRPMFYSLGNFIFQNDTVPNLPIDF